MNGQHVGTVKSDCYNNKTVKVVTFPGYLSEGAEIIFIEFETGFRTAGPVRIEVLDKYTNRIRVSSPITVSVGDLIVIYNKYYKEIR